MISLNKRVLIEKVRDGLLQLYCCIDFEKLDLPHQTPTPNKRSKVEGEEIEEHSPFITTMQDDLEDEQLQTQQTQANHSPISIPDSEICMFVSDIYHNFFE